MKGGRGGPSLEVRAQIPAGNPSDGVVRRRRGAAEQDRRCYRRHDQLHCPFRSQSLHFSIVSSIDLLIRTLLMKYCYITLVWLKIEILNKTHSVIFEFERCSQVVQAVTFSRKIRESQTPFRSRSIYTCMSNCEAKMLKKHTQIGERSSTYTIKM